MKQHFLMKINIVSILITKNLIKLKILRFMDKKIVLVGAGSAAFGPSMFTDIYLSDILAGSTIVLHDIDKEKLEMIYELLSAENKIIENKFNLERTTDRKVAFKDADFIISSIEVGDRLKLWKQDYEIPKKFVSTQIMGECGGPGGSIHAFRIIPHVIDIVKDAEKICPNAFFINFSNPMARVCLAIKRTNPNLRFIGLCHEIGGLEAHLIRMFNVKLENLRIITGGLNHFAFLLGLENRITGEDLMPKFNLKAMEYFKANDHRFDFSTLTFEIYKRFGFFSYGGDNHVGEYLQFAEEFTETQDMIDWINRAENHGQKIFDRILRYYERLKKGKYPRKGMLRIAPSGERAIPIIESILTDKNSHEAAVNIPNNGIIENLPQDLILECSTIVNKSGVQGIKLGTIPKNIAAILRIEASVQDLCVEAILKKSKDLAIACLAIDPNVGSFEMADKIFNEMRQLQRDHLAYFR